MDELADRIQRLQREAAALLARVDDLEEQERCSPPGSPELRDLQVQLVQELDCLCGVLAELHVASQQRHRQVMAESVGARRPDRSPDGDGVAAA
jgi:hypothetical protein